MDTSADDITNDPQEVNRLETATRFEPLLNTFIQNAKSCGVKTIEDYKNKLQILKRKGEGVATEDIKDYNVIKRYKRKQIGRKYKLFRKDLLVVRQDKCFGILWSIHVEKGHAGRNIMLKEIKSRGYGGLSNDVVLAFLSCCEFCKLKQGKIKRGVIVKPMVEKQFNDSAQCDLIDFTSKPDGDFRYLLVFIDHHSKFVNLRAIKNKTADAVKEELLSIFSIFGAPKLLHTDNGREFKNEKIEQIAAEWGSRCVHGKPRHSESQGLVERANRDIEDMIAASLAERDSTQWVSVLPTVQFQKNTRYHSGIKMTPYRALFGVDPTPPPLLFNISSDADENAGDLRMEVIEANKQNENRPIVDESGDEIIPDLVPEWINDQILEESRTEIRQHVLHATENQAERMLRSSNRRFARVTVGTTVLIKIASVDRHQTGPRNLMAVVIEHNEESDLYTLGTKNGRLPQLYSRNQIDPTVQQFLSVSDVPVSTHRSFRAAVGSQSATGTQGFLHCSCLTGCQSNRCRCFKSGRPCNSRCHKSHTCSNNDQPS